MSSYVPLDDLLGLRRFGGAVKLQPGQVGISPAFTDNRVVGLILDGETFGIVRQGVVYRACKIEGPLIEGSPNLGNRSGEIVVNVLRRPRSTSFPFVLVGVAEADGAVVFELGFASRTVEYNSTAQIPLAFSSQEPVNPGDAVTITGSELETPFRLRRLVCPDPAWAIEDLRVGLQSMFPFGPVPASLFSYAAIDGSLPAVTALPGQDISMIVTRVGPGPATFQCALFGEVVCTKTRQIVGPLKRVLAEGDPAAFDCWPNREESAEAPVSEALLFTRGVDEH